MTRTLCTSTLDTPIWWWQPYLEVGILRLRRVESLIQGRVVPTGSRLQTQLLPLHRHCALLPISKPRYHDLIWWGRSETHPETPDPGRGHTAFPEPLGSVFPSPHRASGRDPLGSRLEFPGRRGRRLTRRAQSSRTSARLGSGLLHLKRDPSGARVFTRWRLGLAKSARVLRSEANGPADRALETRGVGHHRPAQDARLLSPPPALRL